MRAYWGGKSARNRIVTSFPQVKMSKIIGNGSVDHLLGLCSREKVLPKRFRSSKSAQKSSYSTKSRRREFSSQNPALKFWSKIHSFFFKIEIFIFTGTTPGRHQDVPHPPRPPKRLLSHSKPPLAFPTTLHRPSCPVSPFTLAARLQSSFR